MPYRPRVATEGVDSASQDPLITARLAEVLAPAPMLFDRLGVLARAAGVPGSKASEDASMPLGHHVRILAVDHLSTGLEHLVMWRRLLMSGVQPNAVHMTLVRGAMEGAVNCRWLIDPRRDDTERVRRGVAMLLDDYANRRGFEKDFGISPDAITPPAKSGADRYTELKVERGTAGIGRITMPDMTTLFGGYIGLTPARGRAMYRLLSAFAHGKQWKGLTADFEEADSAADFPGGRVVRVTANDDVSLAMTTLGARTAATALDELEAYCGTTQSGQQATWSDHGKR